MKVLIALDESPVSLRAAREAVRLLSGADTEFRVLNVARARAKKAGVDDPELLAMVGDPADRICEAADEHDVDVVVVGSHDKGFLRRLIDPSVAAAVVRGTDRPVLVVSGASSNGDSSGG